MTGRPATPLLDLVSEPGDLRRLSDAQLAQVAQELRAETIAAVSEEFVLVSSIHGAKVPSYTDETRLD